MSLINKDFRFREPDPFEPKRSRLRWPLFIMACATIGVVIASTTDYPDDISGMEEITAIPETIKLPLKPSVKSQSIPLSLPEYPVTQTGAIEHTRDSSKIAATTTLPLPALPAAAKEIVVNNTIALVPENNVTGGKVAEKKLAGKKISDKESTGKQAHPEEIQANTPADDAVAEETSKLASSMDTATTPDFVSTDSKSQPQPARKNISLSVPVIQTQSAPVKQAATTPIRDWQELRVKSGDSLAKLFSRAGINARQLDELMKSGDAVKTLRKIFPKDIIRIATDDSGKLQALQYDIDEKSYLMVERKQDKLVAETFDYQIDTVTAHASGSIKSSLFLAAQKAGISQNVIMQLAGIFGWDIDFALDIRKGDTFTVIYEEQYRDGEKISDGNILAAEFVNKGKTYRAVRYTNPQTDRSEYYTAEGKSMRKAFLRTPVNFSRISSRFSINRYHPVLHKFRSHKGVDYAAKRGTPIRAAGDGKVIFKGKKGGYGRVVIIQHGTKYTTLYAHLNSYNKKLRKGSKVKQGQTIAYVGSSGLATGPHLHYEFRVNGVHRNPLTVRLPESKPVPKQYLADFKSATSSIIAHLDSVTRSQVALADTALNDTTE